MMESPCSPCWIAPYPLRRESQATEILSKTLPNALHAQPPNLPPKFSTTIYFNRMAQIQSKRRPSPVGIENTVTNPHLCSCSPNPMVLLISNTRYSKIKPCCNCCQIIHHTAQWSHWSQNTRFTINWVHIIICIKTEAICNRLDHSQKPYTHVTIIEALSRTT